MPEKVSKHHSMLDNLSEIVVHIKKSLLMLDNCFLSFLNGTVTSLVCHVQGEIRQKNHGG